MPKPLRKVAPRVSFRNKESFISRLPNKQYGVWAYNYIRGHHDLIDQHNDLMNMQTKYRIDSRHVVEAVENDKLHPFEASGLGVAPFRLVGIASLPSREMAEKNPEAYNNSLREASATARSLGVHLGTCQHCGMGLIHNFIIRSSDGKNSVVGSDCVAKIHDPGLGNAVKVAERRRAREIARIKREAKREQQRQAWLIANKDRLEQQAKEREAQEKAKQEAALQVRQKWSFILPLLKDQNPYSWKNSVAQSIEAGTEPTGRAIEILADIYGKAHGRRGSAAYDEAVKEFDQFIGR